MSFTNTGLGRRGKSYAAKSWCRRQRHACQSGRPQRGVGAPIQWPTVEKIFEVGNLLRTFYDMKRRAGKAPGVDRIRYEDIGRREIVDILRVVSRATLDGAYRVQESRVVSIPKHGGGKRQLRLGVIVDRVVAGALERALEHGFEKIFLPGSHGFRPRRSAWTMLATLENSVAQSGRRVLVNDDIRGAFDNVRIDSTMECFGQVIGDPALLSLIQTILRGNAGRRRLNGIDQGSPLSPLALNCSLHFAHDLHINQDHRTSWLRYADNHIYLCQDVSEGRQIRAQALALLSSAGQSFKGDGGAKNLIRLDQGEKTQLLGYILSHQGGETRYEMGSDSWSKLDEDLMEAHTSINPSLTARSKIDGWLAWCGPAFENRSQTDLPQKILTTAHRHGFREIGTMDSLTRQWRSSWIRWQQCRDRIRLPHQDNGTLCG